MEYNEKTLDYLKKSSSNKNEFYLFNKIPVMVLNPLPENVSVDNLLKLIKFKIPEHLFYEIDSIFVGQFQELEQRKVKAAYLDGAIYVTNEQNSEKDIFDDIIHEVAHSLEEPYYLDIYGDDKLELEYLGKKQRLLDILRSNGYSIHYTMDTTINYNKEFDEFLYFEIGFKKLESFTRGLFISPYSVTSLSEYFSEGFENYFMKDRSYLNKISPQLFKKVKLLSEPEMD